LWSVGEYRVYKLDINGTVITDFSNPGIVFGLTYDGKYLYGVKEEPIIQKIDINGNVLTSFEVPRDYIRGLTYDGKYFWCFGGF